MAASQYALAERTFIIHYIPVEKERYRGYTHQAHSVVSHARIAVAGRQYSIPEIVVRLRDKKHSFLCYNVLLSYFCHELVTASTQIHSQKDEVYILEDIKVIGDDLRSLNRRYIFEHIKQMYASSDVCPECAQYMTILYMKTTLEHRCASLDSTKNFYHSERDHQFGEWVAKSLFNHDTPFYKTSAVHCKISHIVYASLLQETYFYSEAVKFFLEIDEELTVHLDECPLREEALALSNEDRDRLCAVDSILDYMGYRSDSTRHIYWIAAYLHICRAALKNNGKFHKRKMETLLFPNCSAKTQPFYYTSNRTGRLLHCSKV